MNRIELLAVICLGIGLTFLYHPKPICDVTETSISCRNSGFTAWLRLRQKTIQVDSPPDAVYEYHYERPLSFAEQYVNSEFAWDFAVVFMTAAVSLITYTLIHQLIVRLGPLGVSITIGLVVGLITWVSAFLFFRILYELYALAGILWFFYPFFNFV